MEYLKQKKNSVLINFHASLTQSYFFFCYFYAARELFIRLNFNLSTSDVMMQWNQNFVTFQVSVLMSTMCERELSINFVILKTRFLSAHGDEIIIKFFKQILSDKLREQIETNVPCHLLKKDKLNAFWRNKY